MAKQKGFIKLRGSLGGLTFYELDGKDIVKTTSGVSRQRILNDPNYRRTRENMSEFGGAAKIGKAFRMGFTGVSRMLLESTFSGRVTGIMKRVINLGTGPRGRRAFDIVGNQLFLEGLEFHRDRPFSSVFYAPFALPTLDANREIATWVIPDFNTNNYVNAPEGATHFQLLLNTSVLSNYSYANPDKSYEPVNPDENGVGVTVSSSEIPLTGMVGSDITIVGDLGFGVALPATVGVVIGIGILFYQEINGGFYVLASDNAMQVVVVG